MPFFCPEILNPTNREQARCRRLAAEFSTSQNQLAEVHSQLPIDRCPQMPKKPKRKLTSAERKARRERKKNFMTIFINGKQKRVPRPQLIDGLPIDEFIARNADPIWLHMNGLWEYMPVDDGTQPFLDGEPLLDRDGDPLFDRHDEPLSESDGEPFYEGEVAF